MCDEQWFMVPVVEKIAEMLLPKEYRLRLFNWNEHRFDVVLRESKGEELVAQFFLEPLPGCECAAVISHGAWVDEKHRGRGLGTALLKIRTQAIDWSGFGVALATVRSDNPAERKLLYRAGWRRVTTFPTTGSMVGNFVFADHHVQLWTYHPRGKGEPCVK